MLFAPGEGEVFKRDGVHEKRKRSWVQMLFTKCHRRGTAMKMNCTYNKGSD